MTSIYVCIFQPTRVFLIIIMVKDLIHLTIYKHDVLSDLIVLETETHSKSENLIVNKESS